MQDKLVKCRLMFLSGVFLIYCLIYCSIVVSDDFTENSSMSLNVITEINDHIAVLYESPPVVYLYSQQENESSMKMAVIRRGASHQSGERKAFNLTIADATQNDLHSKVDVYFKNWNDPPPESNPYKEGVFIFGKEVQGFKTMFSSYDDAEWENLEMRIILNDKQRDISKTNHHGAVLSMLISAL